MKNIITGILLGMSQIIPGVSGASMFIVLGVLKKFIDEVNDVVDKSKDALMKMLKPKSFKAFFMTPIELVVTIFKEQKGFLIPIGIFAVLSILIFAKLFQYLNEEQLIIRNAIFLGIIMGTLPKIFKDSMNSLREKNSKKSTITGIVLMALALAFLLVMKYLEVKGIGLTKVEYSSIGWHSFIPVFLIGIIASTAMVLPGISGAMLLIVLGYYDPLTLGLSEFNLMILIPFVLGLVVGVFLSVRIFKVLLDKYFGETYATIFGFVLGSVIFMIPLGLESTAMKISVVVAVISGIIITKLIEAYASRIAEKEEDPETREFLEENM